MEKFSSITTIYMGKDALADAVGGARRVFIVSDPFMVSSGKVSYVTDYLQGSGAEYEIFSDVQADPDIELSLIHISSQASARTPSHRC